MLSLRKLKPAHKLSHPWKVCVYAPKVVTETY